jgi:hypothetical protein
MTLGITIEISVRLNPNSEIFVGTPIFAAGRYGTKTDLVKGRMYVQ